MLDRIQGVLQELGLFLASIARPIARSLRDNGGLAVLSIVLAFGLWIVVTDAENPTESHVLRDEIPVLPVNVPTDVWVPEVVGTIQVRVRVEENVFGSLRADDFQATVNLENLAIGTYDELTVDVRALTDRGGLSIEEVLPDDRIRVELEQLVSKSVRTVAEVRGEPPSGFSISEPELEDGSVVVSGPQEKVDLVTQAAAAVDVSGRTETLEQSVRVQPRDQRNQLVEGLSVEPSLTDVRVVIEQKLFSRVVIVEPEISGVPASGYNVAGIIVNPVSVTVTGPPSLIEEAVSIRTQPVDIDGAEDDLTRTVSLEVPQDAKVIGSASVAVTVRIEPATGQTVFVVPVAVTGLAGDLAISGNLPTVEVLLAGPLPELRKLRASDVRATINLSGKEAGTHLVDIEVAVPEGVQVTSTIPAEIEVALVQQ